MAGVALVGAGVIAVTPVAPAPPEIRVPEIRVGSAEVRLAADSSSLLNVPVNLVIDLINVPYNEVQGLNELSSSLLFSGPWFVASATNLWGIDPGDPGHFMGITDVLVPFPALSGLGLGELNQNGLGQDLWQLAAAELPVNGYCDASGCPPNVPTSPITGITALDQYIWDFAILTGQENFPLLDNFFNVSLSKLASGYTFGPTSPDYADPSGPANAIPGYQFLGTTTVTGPNGTEYLMPWANTTFTLSDLALPFQNFFTSLMADPSTNPIELPSLTQVGRALQAFLAAAVVAFDPLTPGSPFCPGQCSSFSGALNYPAIVQDIANAWPGNTLIDDWLTAYDNGIANVPTEAQIQATVTGFQQGFWDFGNPNPPSALSTGGFNFSTLASFFHSLWTALGLNPPALATPATTPAPATTSTPATTAAASVAAAVQAPATTPAPSIAADPAPTTAPAPSIAPLKQKPLQGDVKQASTPQGSEGQKSGGVPQVGQGLDNAQPATGKDTQSTTTSTNPADGVKKPKVTSGGNMAQPIQTGANGTTSGSRRGDPATSFTDQISSAVSKVTNSKVTNGFSGGTKSGIPVSGGKK